MSTLRVNNLTDAGGTGPTYAKGHVIQLQSSSSATQLTTTSTSYVDVPGLSVSITPKFSTSKIYVTYTAYQNSQVQNNETYISLFRGTTNLNTANGNSGFGGVYTQSGGWTATCATGSIFDSPNTTSPVTYSVKFRTQTGTTSNINPANQLATITVMEVAA